MRRILLPSRAGSALPDMIEVEIIDGDEDRWWAWSRDIVGCATWAWTEEDVIARISVMIDPFTEEDVTVALRREVWNSRP